MGSRRALLLASALVIAFILAWPSAAQPGSSTSSPQDAFAATAVHAPGNETARSSGWLQDAFVGAAVEFGVPPEIVIAVSYVETHWVDNGSVPSFANGFGLMHLQSNPHSRSLEMASRLIGATQDDIKRNTTLNIRGGAAVLRHLYGLEYPRETSTTTDLARWYLPVSAYLQTGSSSPARNFADAVFMEIDRGRTKETPHGRVTLPARPGINPDRGRLAAVPSDLELARRFRSGGRAERSTIFAKLAAPAAHAADLELPADQWRAAPLGNYTAGRIHPQMGVIIHTCQGGHDGCLAWMQNPASGVSAHFLVRSVDGLRTQLVHRWDRAHHCGPPPPAGTGNCPHAVYGSWNEIGIGIEHEGWTDNPAFWYTPRMYAQSAWISAYTCWLANWGGCDSGHVVGHDDDRVSPPSMKASDPGPGWDWGWYRYCVSLRFNYLAYGWNFADCLG